MSLQPEAHRITSSIARGASAEPTCGTARVYNLQNQLKLTLLHFRLKSFVLYQYFALEIVRTR